MSEVEGASQQWPIGDDSDESLAGEPTDTDEHRSPTSIALKPEDYSDIADKLGAETGDEGEEDPTGDDGGPVADG